jgi:MiaB-like tRNA modifying enzyme
MDKKIVYLETYGCSANQNNSEILAGILSRNGFIITTNPEIAQIIILNTCVVKEKTESKIKRKIQDLSKNNSKLIIVTGCMPQTDFKKIKKLNKNILFLGTHHFKEIINILKDYENKTLNEKKQQDYLTIENEIKLNLPKIPNNKLISIQQISEGCLGECTYCKTRLAKGKLFSYPKEQIIKSIQADLNNGAKEIWLTSQDCAAYWQDNKDNEKNQFLELLNEILNLKNKFKLRLGMSNPNHLSTIIEKLIEIYKDKKIYKFLHLPIQSASNSILKDMKRKYTIEQAENIIKKFRSVFPSVVIATDIIVGYPSEKEEDHERNKKFIEEFKPDVLNLSKFSSHKGTEASKLKILKNNIIKKRTNELMQVHRKTAKENKEKYFNKIINVFVNKSINNNLYEARDENYNIILLKTDKSNLGKEIKVKITEIGVHHLIGEIV